MPSLGQAAVDVIRLIGMIRMARLTILPGGILAYGLGVSMAYGHRGAVDWRLAAMGLFLQVCANLMAHYADEYADVDTDALTRRTLFSGGSGVLPSGVVPPSWALGAAVAFGSLAAVVGGFWVLAGAITPHILWLGALALPLGWVYSMPPVALERRGLGEVVNAFIGAVLMPLMGYTVQAGSLGNRGLLHLGPVFCAVLAGIIPVHWSDRAADAMVGRRSLVLALGDRRIRALHASLVVLFYLGTLGLWGWALPGRVVAAATATLPLGLWAMARFTRQHSPIPSSLFMAAALVATAIGWAAR